MAIRIRRVAEEVHRRLKKRKSIVAPTLLLLLLLFPLIFVKALIIRMEMRSLSTTSKTWELRLQCAKANLTQTCPNKYLTKHSPPDRDHQLSSHACPPYFKWIHEDLRPWKENGITRDMVEGVMEAAQFKLVILDGKAYVEKFRPAYQTRDVFTLWGVLQLLRLYPGRLPDLELMFSCEDRPVIKSRDFHDLKPGPPPLFGYCKDGETLDIVFPDWSFWGWVETNIKPWRDVLKDIDEGNKRTKWTERVPYAYWRGNPYVSRNRVDLLNCNVSEKHDWNTRLYGQRWDKESKEGFKHSKLEDQCTHRYKIYIEGQGWSVSEKYILACDSMTLLVTSQYTDFFSRGLIPLKHYWPIRNNTKCPSLKFAVEWGNNHTEKAKAIGEAGHRFVHKDLKMEYVYDYMFHLLNEYAKLLTYKPTVPPGAMELCSETLACSANGTYKKFMLDAMVASPSPAPPCTLPPPYDPPSLKAFVHMKAELNQQVETWENEYWKSVDKNKKQ